MQQWPKKNQKGGLGKSGEIHKKDQQNMSSQQKKTGFEKTERDLGKSQKSGNKNFKSDKNKHF